MKTLILALVISSMVATATAQQGRVFDNLTLESKILKTEKRYAIYLPPDYETSERRYPVLYLLHGGGGSQMTWVQHGEVRRIADQAIKEGRATPMIIVMPDASKPVRGWRNDPAGNWLFEDYFFDELIPFIDRTYRTRPGKRYRNIAGLSGGGNATFVYALHHPEAFAAACPLSPATFPFTMEDAEEMLPERYQGLTKKQIEDYYFRYSIPELLKNMPENRKKAVRWYIETGDDDHLEQVYEGNCILHILMRKNGIPHEFRVNDGGHNWKFWRSALPAVLEFVSYP